VTLHPDNDPELAEFLSICRQLNTESRYILRGVIISKQTITRPLRTPRRHSQFPAIKFVLSSSLLAIALFSLMPAHPLAIPTAVGGGTSIAILVRILIKL